MNDPLETLLEEFDSYDYDELLSDTNYNNSHLTNQDESEGIQWLFIMIKNSPQTNSLKNC